MVISASAAGEASAAPRPWRPRAASSSGSFGGDPAEQRGDGEDHQADREDLAATVEVPEPTAEQQQATEGQGITGDDPGQAGIAEAEVSFDERQGNVGDGAVEHHHQLGRRDEHQGPAEVRVLSGGPGRGLEVAHLASFLLLEVRGARKRGGQDDLVDHPDDQGCVGQLAEDVDTVQHDAGERGSDQVEVEIGSHVAALAGPVEDLAGDGELGADHLAAEGRTELLVPGECRDHARERRHRRLVGEAAGTAVELDEVATQGAGVGRLGHRLDREEGVDDQADLAVPAAVERRLGGACAGGHRIHRQPVVADVGEDRERGLQDLDLAVTLDARTGGRRLGGLGHRAPVASMERNGFVSSKRLEPRIVPGQGNYLLGERGLRHTGRAGQPSRSRLDSTAREFHDLTRRSM